MELGRLRRTLMMMLLLRPPAAPRGSARGCHKKPAEFKYQRYRGALTVWALNPGARARGRKIEQQTFVVEHLRKAAAVRRRARPVLRSSGHGTQALGRRCGADGGDMSEPRPIGAIEESVFDLIVADFTCLARIADAQGMTPELEAIADAFDANLVEGIAAVLESVSGQNFLFSKMRRRHCHRYPTAAAVSSRRAPAARPPSLPAATPLPPAARARQRCHGVCG